jgi:hypothetical protein
MWAVLGRTWKAAPKCAMFRKSLRTGKRKSRGIMETMDGEILQIAIRKYFR